jgi:hypothetical protein
MTKIQIWTIGIAAIIAGLMPESKAATTYTWTGGNGATPWYHVDNWDTNGVPLEGTFLGTATWNDLIVIDSEQVAYMPSDAIVLSAKWFSGVRMIPQLHVKNGTITLQGNGFLWWFWGDDSTTTTLTIGDGDINTAAVVNGQFSDWSRDVRGSFNTLKIVVNEDGTFNNDRDIATWGETGIPVQLTINGGTVNFNSVFTDGLTNQVNSWVSFDQPESSFTAKFGGQLPDFSTLQANVGDGRSFRMGGSGHDKDVFLESIDNGDNTFTITFVDPPPQGTLITLY